ncbi:hypothetical protein YC2023_110852 [Brassica napus]
MDPETLSSYSCYKLTIEIYDYYTGCSCKNCMRRKIESKESVDKKKRVKRIHIDITTITSEFTRKQGGPLYKLLTHRFKNERGKRQKEDFPSCTAIMRRSPYLTLNYAGLRLRDLFAV